MVPDAGTAHGLFRPTVGSENSAGLSEGGGIWAGGNVTVTSSTISGNSTGFFRGDGSGISAGGDVTVTSSTISGNSPLYSGEGGDGGGIRATGDVTITSSTISRNSASRGGGIQGGGDVIVTSSEISGNSVSNRYSGGLAGGNVTVTSSTVSGNSAKYGGGIWASDVGTVTIENSIVAGNTTRGGAPDLRPGTGTLTVRYSLIGDNTGTSLVEAPVGTPDADGNLIGDPNGAGIIDPMLAPLTDNGGPTETHALLFGSPAIDMGEPDFTPPPEFDQRDDPFARVFGIRIDIGAYERHTGDMDFDGGIDFDDIGGFALGLAFSLDYEQQYGAEPNANGDTDGDGDQDFDDIPGFVELLGGDPLFVGSQAVGESVSAVQRVDAAPNVDMPEFTSLPLRSASVGSWLTVAFVGREPNDQDRTSRSDQAPAAEKASHRILDRVLQSRHIAIQERRGVLPRARPPAQVNRDNPTTAELAAVWTDDWDWLERRPP